MQLLRAPDVAARLPRTRKQDGDAMTREQYGGCRFLTARRYSSGAPVRFRSSSVSPHGFMASHWTNSCRPRSSVCYEVVRTGSTKGVTERNFEKNHLKRSDEIGITPEEIRPGPLRGLLGCGCWLLALAVGCWCWLLAVVRWLLAVAVGLLLWLLLWCWLLAVAVGFGCWLLAVGWFGCWAVGCFDL